MTDCHASLRPDGRQTDSSLISVVMPIYCGERTLVKSMNSVLSQEVESMEVIALDDGSRDASWQIVTEFRDKRLVAVQHANRGLAATLNRGIELAQGTFIARQDQDDLVLPGRLKKQLDYLESNPDVAMVGTWAQIYSEDQPTDRYHRHPCTSEALRLELLFDNPFVHSSVMVRANVLREVGGYCEDKSRQPPEDYELWSRIARKYPVANLPEVLTIYREMPSSMSRTGVSPFLKNVVRIATENLQAILEPDYELDRCKALAEVYHGVSAPPAHFSRSAARAMLELASRRIGGAEGQWSDEFRACYSRLRRHIDSCFRQRSLRARLLAPARWLKNRFRHGGRDRVR